jgi:predicted DNA-binding ribbon-helix-helix protein
MRAAIVKRSVSIAGHRTSISLEEPFWDALRAIATERGVSFQALVGEIDSRRAGQNLSSAIRVFVLEAALDGTISRPRPQIAEIEAPSAVP